MWKWKRKDDKDRLPSKEVLAIAKLGEQQQEKMTALAEQLTKLTRVEYKANQDTQRKLDAVVDELTGLRQVQAELADTRQALVDRNSAILQLSGSLIRLLDDFDALTARLDGAENEAWRSMLAAWTGSIITELRQTGIHEIAVLGEPFNPKVAEAVGTVALTELSGSRTQRIPYEVVEVINRGFVDTEGQLLRKARVITLKEGEHDESGT